MLPPAFKDQSTKAQPLRHSLARTGFLRRILTLPNPILYANLCSEIVAGWADIQAVIAKGSLSRSKPQFNPKAGRSVLPLVPIQSDLMPIRAEVRAGARALLRTDLSRFYGSIYTHSIPWALHTKPVAKARRHDDSLLGNRLDLWLRNAQDSQTVGIAIGPDASLVIAESLLAAVDERLQKEAKILRGLRYVDDYELAFDSRSAAEEALSMLEQILGEFELELNPRKTMLQDLPLPHEPQWVSTLRSMPVRDTPAAQANDLVHLSDRAFEFAREDTTSPVLRYAVGRLKSIDIKQENRTLLQHLLLQYVVAAPGTLATTLGVLIKGMHDGWQLEEDIIAETLNRLMRELLAMGHGNEACWCLWGIFALELLVEASSAAAISVSEDPLVALLALHGRAHGLLPDSLDTTNWESAMTGEDLYGDRWLLAYEALVKGWLPSLNGVDYVGVDPRFSILQNAKVEFFDGNMIAGVVPTGVAPSVGVAPIFSL